MSTLGSIYQNKETRGDITVKKTYNVPVDRIYIEEGFNVKGKIYPDTVAAIYECYKRGDVLPELIVEPQDDGRFKIIDGHHRFTAILDLIKDGLDYRRVTVRGFNGSMVEQIALMINSSQGRNLNPVERAEAYGRLSVFNLTKEEIAEAFNVSVPSVIHHLAVSELASEVKEYISNGKIAADYALELSRKHTTEQIINIIDGTLKKGKKKATRKNTSSWRPAIGKSVVSMLSSVEVSEDDGGNVILVLTDQDYELLSKAIGCLGLEGKQ